MTALRSLPVAADALAALGMAGAEIVPVVVANNRGTAALWAGDLDAAERYLTAAMHADLDGLAIPQLNAMAYHCLLRCERGELDPAEAAARRVIDTAAAAGLATAVHVGRRLPDLGAGDPRPRRHGRGRRMARAHRGRPGPGAGTARPAGRRDHPRDPARGGGRPRGGTRGPAGAGRPRALAPAARFARTVADSPRPPFSRAPGDGAAAAQLLERMGPAGTPEGMIAAARVHLLLGDLEAATAVRAHAAPAVHVRGRVTTAVLDALLAAAAGARAPGDRSPRERPGHRRALDVAPTLPGRGGTAAAPARASHRDAEPPCRDSRSTCSNGHPASPWPTPSPAHAHRPAHRT